MSYLTEDKLVILGAAGAIGSNMMQTALTMRLTPHVCGYDPFGAGMEGAAEEMYHCSFPGARVTWTTDIAEALKDADRGLGGRAAWALQSIGPDAKAAVPALTQALRHDEEEVRLQAAETLGAIGPDAVASVPALTEALGDNDEDVRSAAAGALEAIGPDANAAVPALIEALTDANLFVRMHATCALRRIGPPAHLAVPALIDALEDPSIREVAEEALRKIRGEDDSGV